MDLLENLFARRRFNIIPGLERTRELAEFCGNPQKSFRSIHIAGTNGKGSTATMLASILVNAGYKTGLYTSPHIYEFNERIKINSIGIPTDDLKRIAEDLLPKADEIGATFFEITTVLAWRYFAENNVDFAVIECGMGGENDSTNIIEPILSVITHIAFDHSEYLGDSLKAIAKEKSGIIKPNTPVVIARNDEQFEQIFIAVARKKSAEIVFAGNSEEIKSYKTNAKLTTAVETIHYADINFPLAGKHQIDNLATVFAASAILEKQGIINIKDIKIGIENLKSSFGLNYRTELIAENPPIIFDAAHNPDSVSALVEMLADSPYKHNKWNIVFAAMADKEIDTMLKLLKPIAKHLFLPKLATERAQNPCTISNIAESEGFVNIYCESSPLEAYHIALSFNEPVLVVGSFYLLSEIRI